MQYISQNDQKRVYENTCSFWQLAFTHILFKYSLMFKGASHKSLEEILDYSKHLMSRVQGTTEISRAQKT